jgi:aryl-alcohol dehydrogenase-like predicted oxidoreductase
MWSGCTASRTHDSGSPGCAQLDLQDVGPDSVGFVTALARTDLDVFPLCLGGNVFGWTADEEQSFAVLDAYAAAGGNFIDTADTYSSWAPGHEGGESETIIGRWLAARGNRDRMIIATKVAKLGSRRGLSAANIQAAAEDSLRRLGTDRIDLYYAHEDDETIPIEESLGAFDALVKEGKVRYVAASNYEPERLSAALAIADRDGLAPYVALQPEYNLVRRGYEGALRDVCSEHGLACFPYFSLAMGFLTGKYRPGGEAVDSPRARGAAGFLDERGVAVLAALDAIAAAHATTVASVALAWLAAQPTVAAPIASARTPEQLADLLPMATLSLTAGEIEQLTAASA